jgi:hypothetical protein
VRSRAALTAAALLAVSVGVSGSSALSAVSGAPPNRAEIAAAFAHLVGTPRPADALRPYLQGVDGAMAAALAKGAVNERAEQASLLPDGKMRVSAVRRLSGSVASVAFGITQRGQGPPYTWHFVGTAVYSHGRWMASWATVCMLVEQEGVPCPNPPAGVVRALPLPYSVTAHRQASEQSPDLIRPGALAVTASGDLLIADSVRDQIVEWHPSGLLTVFAGTGRPGFSGDGGPGRDARLSSPGGMAMSSTGTLYFVDGSRVRAISPGGIIRTVAGNGRSGTSPGNGPALRRPLDPSDVAVAKDGTPYIASNDEILKLSSSGVLSTFAKGSPPHGDVSTPSGPMAFSPQNIAFDGADNLDVFSFSSKEMFQVSPSGTIRPLGGAYTAQMATAPGGDVLTAAHGEQVGHITQTGAMGRFLALSQRIHGLGSPGDERGLEPNGIAVSSSGIVYLDSFWGNGWAGGTSLVRVTAKRTLQALPIRTPLLETLPSLGSAGFPASIYPAAPAARGTDLQSCPNGEGLEPFDANAIAAARASARKFNAYTSSFYGDLQSSDPSWWKSVFAEWVGYGYDRDNHTVLSVQPAGRDTFAAAVTHACGENLLQQSLVVDVGPSAYSFQVSHLYFLNRRGHPLIYFQAS